jgi:hypothetical protein
VSDRSMSAIYKTFIVSVGLAIAAPNGGGGIPQTRQKQLPEQSIFGSDSALERPVPIPKAAQSTLQRALQAKPDELTEDSLQVSKIHLDGPAEIDLIVVGQGAGHAAPFYVLRPTTGGYRLILNSGGDSLTVLRSRSRGFRDIQVEGFAAAGEATTKITFRFDGREYKKAIERTTTRNDRDR